MANVSFRLATRSRKFSRVIPALIAMFESGSPNGNYNLASFMVSCLLTFLN